MKRVWVRLRVWWGIIFGLTVIGFWMRFARILSSYSFWNDEAQVAIWAKSLLLGRGVFYFRGLLPTGLYQLFTYYLTALSMWVFGMNEFGARVVYVVIGSLIIPMSAWVALKLSNKKWVGIVVPFLVAFSNLEIAWSQQVRPYIVLQFLFLILIWGWIRYVEGKVGLYKWAITSLVLSIVMTLFHTSAFVVGVLILGVVGYKVLRQDGFKSSKIWGLVGLTGVLFVILFIKLKVFKWGLCFVSNIDLNRVRFKIWHFIFFWKHYLFYLPWAVAGWLRLFQKTKYRLIAVSILLITIILTIAVLVRPANSTYVRYTLISFPFVFIFTALGISWLASYLNLKRLRFLGIVLTVALIIGLGIKNHTLSFCSTCYHSINADVRENPLADYKRFFNEAKPYFDKYPDMALVDAWEDRDIWYLNRKVDAFMIARNDHQGKKTELGGAFVTNVDELKRFLQKKGKALVIIEGWPSLAGNKMQAFVRKSLKFKYKVCDKKLANEGWCLELYSYGVKNGKN